MFASRVCSCFVIAPQRSYSRLNVVNARCLSSQLLAVTPASSSEINNCHLPQGQGSRLASYKNPLHSVTWTRSYSWKKKEELKEIPVNIATLQDVGEEDEFFEEFVEKKKWSKKDGNTSTGNYRKKIEVQFGRNKKLSTADADNLLRNLHEKYPQLADFPDETIVGYLERMAAFGIDVNKASEMLIINPDLMGITKASLSAVIEALRSIGISEKQRKHLVRRCPQLFQCPPKRISKHFTFLKTYFSVAEALDVIEQSIEVFFQSESLLKKKLDFLIKGMSHETKNIVSCKALSYPLKHMKTRHEFLIRAGFFKPIPYRKLIKVLEKDYKDRNKQREKYFKPIYIVCYKDEDFLKICTNNRLTLNELAAFEELYAAELEAKEQFEMEEIEGEREEDLEDESDPGHAVKLIGVTNSQDFFNDVEANSCYF